MTTQAQLIDSTIANIKAEGLHRIRCSLTGAPYATIDDSEIRLALRTEIENNKSIDSEALLDAWHIRALPHNSRVCPALVNAKRVTMNVLLLSGTHGEARVVTWCLSRLFFPPQRSVDGIVTTSQRAIDRMVFASRVFDNMANADALLLGEWLQKLAACDSYCTMSAWQQITRFTNRRAKEGIHAAKNKDVAGWFNETESFDGSKEQMERLLDFLLTLMVDTATNDSALPAKGNDMATDIFAAQAEAVPVPTRPVSKTAGHDKIAIAEAERRFRMRVVEDNRVRYAYSATLGKGISPRRQNPLDQWAFEEKKKLNAAKRTAKENRKTAKGRKKKSNPVQDAMAAAFANLKF